MLLLLNANSETTASIPKKKIPRHHGCEMERTRNLQSKWIWVSGGWRKYSTPRTWLRHTAKQLYQATELRRGPWCVGGDGTDSQITPYVLIFLMLKNLSGVWDHSGVPMALGGSLLLCMPDEPGALENQISSKRFGEAVRENCIKEDPPAPKLLRFKPSRASL